jgi:crotonobetainyl-CoA:carnitine CoA-transferase CaiB-like acyl-CoA transferase
MTKPTVASQGLRVIEYVGPRGGIAVAYAGWLLASMGAEVTRWVSPSARDHELPEQLAIDTLAYDKRETSAPNIQNMLAALSKDYDILLCDEPNALIDLFGGADVLRNRAPELTIGVASTFGLDGPYADFAATSLDAQALSGVAWSLGEVGRSPLSLPPGILEHQTGALLASGCLLSQMLQEAGGGGRIVDIALADVLASYVAGNCRFYIHHGLQWHRSGRRASGSGGAYPFMILPCQDGDVCVCGRTRAEWERLVAAMGNPPWASQSRYRSLRAMGREYPDEVDALIAPWFAEHSKQELEAIALANNLIVSPVREFADVLATAGFTERGFFKDDRAAGQNVHTPGLPFKVSHARSESATDFSSTLLHQRITPSQPPARPDPDKPLDGLRVIDLGWVWSAPWVSTFLGELGAQVIKVENRERPDNLRLAGRLIRDGAVVEGPSREMSPMYHQVNHGKLGITLNLKEPRAKELLRQLVASSDIVIENMSPGSLERSELGYDAFRLLNPKLVMLSMSAAGQFGSLSGMRAYAPTMSSFVGLEAMVGYAGEKPLGALNFALSDPSAAVQALVPLLAALRQARATGEGSYVDLSQTEALLGTLRPYLIAAQVGAHQPSPLGNSHPAMAPHGIYPAAGPDEWLTIAVQDDEQWRALASIASDESWAREARYASTTGRVADADALDAELAKWTAQHARDALVMQLRQRGVASSPVLSIEELWNDPHFAARGLKTQVDLPFYGPESIFRAPWKFSDLQPQVTRCGPTTGEHNAYVFGEILGLSDSEISALESCGILA